MFNLKLAYKEYMVWTTVKQEITLFYLLQISYGFFWNCTFSANHYVCFTKYETNICQSCDSSNDYLPNINFNFIF